MITNDYEHVTAPEVANGHSFVRPSTFRARIRLDS